MHIHFFTGYLVSELYQKLYFGAYIHLFKHAVLDTPNSAVWAVSLVIICGREEGAVGLNLPIGSLKICCGLEPVIRCEPSTHQPISQ